jgi:hypothetical protein
MAPCSKRNVTAGVCGPRQGDSMKNILIGFGEMLVMVFLMGLVLLLCAVS